MLCWDYPVQDPGLAPFRPRTTKNSGCFSAYMSGSSSPSTSSAPTIYQLSSLPPPSTLSDVAIDSDLLKPPGKKNSYFPFCVNWISVDLLCPSPGSLTEYLGRYEAVIKILTTWGFFLPAWLTDNGWQISVCPVLTNPYNLRRFALLCWVRFSALLTSDAN